jgi:ADP-ribosylglycohydrolase
MVLCFVKEVFMKYILGATAGDIIGSIYEFDNIKTTDFPLFSEGCCATDDSIMTFATMDVLLNKGDYTKTYQEYGRKYPDPDGSYGSNFLKWIHTAHPRPYNSWGNGSAMRVSPVGWAFDTLAETLEEAKNSAEVTHNHPEGIKGAQATAASIYLARNGKTKDEIKKYIVDTFSYNLDRKIDEIRPTYHFDVSCQGSVPEAIIAFLESIDYENAIRLAISIGGDSDTIGCITGGIAEAFYGQVPNSIAKKVLEILPKEFVLLAEAFSLKYRKQFTG